MPQTSLEDKGGRQAPLSDYTSRLCSTAAAMKLASRPEDWRWSSVHDYTGSVNAPAGPGSPILVDRVLLPGDERRRI